MASGIKVLLNSIEIHFAFQVKCNTATGAIKIEETSEGIHASNAFDVPSDFCITYWEIETNGVYPWRNIEETIIYPDINNFHSNNGVSRNTEMRPVRLSYMYNTYESGFNIYSICIVQI